MANIQGVEIQPGGKSQGSPPSVYIPGVSAAILPHQNSFQ